MKHQTNVTKIFSVVFLLSCSLFTSSLIFTKQEDVPTEAINTDIAQRYFDLAQKCIKKGLPEDALECYQEALKNNPYHPETLRQLGNNAREKDQFDQAIGYYNTALEANPKNLLAILELANTLNILDRTEESLALYIRALEIQPTNLAALHNFAYSLNKMSRPHDAIMVFKKLTELSPNYALAHFNLSAALLRVGNFEEGWKEYEWRWQAYNESSKRFAQPLWEGEDLRGKRIVVFAEQGLGDTKQFMRYVPMLKEKGAYVIFETQAALINLLRLCPYLDEVIIRNEKLPDFDFQIPLMTLPLRFNTTVETIPHKIPYLYADPKLVTEWKEKLSADKNFKIGICWHGNGNYPTQPLRRSVESKSIPLAKLAQLAKLEHVSIYSLQQIDGLDQLASLDQDTKIIQFPADFDKKNGRFMDTAAVMLNLDLVISVDTSTVHLAGGLGVQTWLLLPEPPDWRWILNRTDSPWYPTMRLFKQEKLGDWDNVMLAITQNLLPLIEQHKQKHLTRATPATNEMPSIVSKEPLSTREKVQQMVAQELANYRCPYINKRNNVK